MIIYFADRNLEIKGLASTSLQGGLRITEDTLTESIESAVNTFSFSIALGDENRLEMTKLVRPGRYILRSDGRSEEGIARGNSYSSLYQIIDTEYDTKTKELSVYAEDAGLELIGRICPPVKLSEKSLEEMLLEFVPSDWQINLIDCPIEVKTYEWDGENSATERINSVAALFNCEIFYSFEIERLEIKSKTINVTSKRGNQDATVQLRLNKDIDRISSKSSIAELATALTVSGGTPDGKDKPITLKGYNYEYVDPRNGDRYVVEPITGQLRNESAMRRWASKIDSDGLILKSFSFETTNKAELAGQARAELQRLCFETVEYEVDFVKLPEEARVGDRINIIDEGGELYLEARILAIESSVTAKSQTATIGDYVLKSGGVSASVSDSMKALVKEAVKSRLEATTISIVSSGGNLFHNAPIDTTLIATVFYGERVISDQTELEEVFGEGASVKWFNANGVKLSEGMSLRVESESAKEDITCELHDGGGE